MLKIDEYIEVIKYLKEHFLTTSKWLPLGGWEENEQFKNVKNKS